MISRRQFLTAAGTLLAAVTVSAVAPQGKGRGRPAPSTTTTAAGTTTTIAGRARYPGYLDGY